MFRIKGLIVIGLTAIIVTVLSFISPDAWLEENIEYQASILNEAKVEIEDFDFDLFGLKVSWKRMQVANPNNTMTNTFETGETEFDLLFWPILWNRVLIEDIKLTGFKMDTDRETDGAFELPLDEEGNAKEPGFVSEVTKQITRQISNNARMKIADIKDDINVDSLMAKVNIQSVDKMDSLQASLQQKYRAWEHTLQNNPIEQQADSIQKTISSLEVPKLKEPEKVIKALETVKKLNSQVNGLKKDADSLKKAFENDFTNSKDALGNIDEWISQDIQRAATVAKLPDLNAQNIGTVLFGGNLLGDFAAYLEYIALARTYGSRLIGADEKEEKIERYEGVDYHFSNKYDWPSFWIQNIELSGETNTGIALSGKVTNISSDQKKTGEPIIIDLGGESGNISLTVRGELDYRDDKPREKVMVTYEGFPLSGTRISPSELLKYDLTSGTGRLSLNLELIDRRIDGQINYSASDIAFDFESAGAPDNRVESLIREVIRGTDTISATALIDNTGGPLRVRVRSNLDDLFLDALQSTVSRQVAEARNKIRNEVENRVTEKRRELERMVSEREARIRKEYDRLEAKVEEELRKVEAKKKELEEKKKELEKSLLDSVRKKIGF